MSILSSFKKALGFPDEYDDELDDALDDHPQRAVSAESHKKDQTVKAENSLETPDQTIDMPAPTSPELPGEVFDAVIQLFNATQPDFVRQCLSTDSQRAYLMEHIDQSLKASLEKETANARRRGEIMWEEEKRKMAGDIDKLRSEYHSLKQQREEFQSAQLSAARQKRALKERVQDLESQVSKLEAEREQMQLENRSMLNKLRVANVRATADGNSEAELQRLAQENVNLQDRINGMCDDRKKAEATIAELNKTITALREETASDKISAEQQAAMAEIEERIRQFEEIKARKDKKINELSVQNRQSANEIKNLSAKLTESLANAEKLTSELKELHKTTEQQSSAAVETEQSLRDEVKRLTQLLNANETEAPRKKRPGRKPKKKFRDDPALPTSEPSAATTSATEERSEDSAPSSPGSAPESAPASEGVKISAIDELMDSTDWFIAPEPIPVKKDPEVEEDFGYKEPPTRRSSRDDDKQLSLF